MICEPVPAAAVQLVPVCKALPRAVIGRRVKLIVAICPEPLGGIVLVDLVQLVRELHQLNVAVNAAQSCGEYARYHADPSDTYGITI